MTAETPSGAATPPKAPAKLGRHGRKLWRDLTGKYDFDVWELPLLEAACRQRDAIADLDQHVADHGIATKGSTGQTRLSPMVTEARLARRALASMLTDLRLPEDTDAAAGGTGAPVVKLPRPRTGRSRQAQAAAERRWALDRERRAARGEQRRQAAADERARRLGETS